MARPFSGISIALVVCGLLAGLAPLDWALVNVAIPVGSAPDAPAFLFWLGALLTIAHYDAPRDPEKAARLPRPDPRMGASFTWGAAAVALSLALYARALQGPFLGLDWTMIDRVRAALDADGLGRWLSAMARPEPGEDYVGPLTQMTWLAQYAVWGERPLPYRALNVVIHGINSAFVLRLAGYWLRGRWSAPIAAALFLFSPLAVEHAVWASGRGDLLGATAALATINAYARFRRGGAARWKWVAAGVYALGLLASETLALLPVVLLVGEWTGAFAFEQGRGIRWRELAPFAALAALFGAAWVWGGGSAPPIGLGPALRKIFIDAPSLYFAPLYPTPGRPEEFLRLAGQGFMLMIVLLSGVTARGEGRSVTLALSLILMGTVGGLLFHTQKSMSVGWRPMYLPTVGFSLFLAQVFTPPPESKRLRVSVKAASVAVLVLASIWATARNQGPWTRLAKAMSAFEEQGARLLRASPPEARVHFIGYPMGRGIHVPGLADRHPPPLTLARLAPEASAVARLIVRDGEIACGADERGAREAKPCDWRTLDWGGRDRLAHWDARAERIVLLDPLLRERQASLGKARAPKGPRIELLWSRFPQVGASERQRIGLEAEHPFSPFEHGVLALSLRADAADRAGPARVRVEWRSPELAGTTLAPPAYETTISWEEGERAQRPRVDLLGSLAWVLTPRLTRFTVEVDGPLWVSDLELLPSGS